MADVNPIVAALEEIRRLDESEPAYLAEGARRQERRAACMSLLEAVRKFDPDFKLPAGDDGHRPVFNYVGNVSLSLGASATASFHPRGSKKKQIEAFAKQEIDRNGPRTARQIYYAMRDAGLADAIGGTDDTSKVSSLSGTLSRHASFYSDKEAGGYRYWTDEELKARQDDKTERQLGELLADNPTKENAPQGSNQEGREYDDLH